MVYNQKKLFSFLLLPLFILGLIIFFYAISPVPLVLNSSNLKTGTLNINNSKIKIEIASSEKEQYYGLSNRQSLCFDCGMLFDFSNKTELSFVMRDMNFPLDIIFINDNKIINIATNLAPEGTNTKNTYSSLGEVNRVLELNGGFCEKYGIKAGDYISEPVIN